MQGEKQIFGLLRPRWARPYIEEPIDVDVDESESDREQKSPAPWTAFFLIILALLSIATSCVEYLTGYQPLGLAIILIWTLILLSLIIFRPRTGSFILTSLYLSTAACQVVNIARVQDGHGSRLSWNAVTIVLALLSLTVSLNMQLRPHYLPRKGISKPFTKSNSTLRSPEDNLTMWQWMTVSWMAPLVNLGMTRQLNDDDVWLLAYEFQHTHLHEAFRNLKGTVVRRLIKANWLDLVILACLACLELAANYSAPIILQQLLRSMQWIEMNKKPAIIWGSLILVVEIVAAQSGVFSLWFGRRAYERSRGEMITMLHEKVLNRKILGGKPVQNSDRIDDVAVGHTQSNHQEHGANDDTEDQGLISGETKKSTSILARAKGTVSQMISCISPRQKRSTPEEKLPASMGKILNLMRNDVYEVAQRFWEFQSLINTPVGLIVSLTLIWRLIGWTSLIGISVVIVAQLINAVLARILMNWEKVRRKATDHKLQQISQYVEAIRHLRWYGWHARKLETVISARQKELNLRIITSMWNNAIKFVNIFAGGIPIVAAFWGYTALAGQRLTVDIAFPAIQIFTLMQTHLRDIPNLITVLLNAAVAVGRIEDFMSEPDVATENKVVVADRLELHNASFAWPGLQSNILHKLNVVFQHGLTVVIGPVASGKSALLQALLGELDLRDGELIRPDAPMGYCAQAPWLESMTIRDNILFCSEYEDQRYRKALEACALLPDLASFKQGDLSPIGENGIGLSGGQKARVALARAIYSRAEILLLDDPLSALDQQTAEWIVTKCLSGPLVEGRIVILVTHRTDLCQNISQQIVELSDGHAKVHEDAADISNGRIDLDKTTIVSDHPSQIEESAAIREKFEDEEHRAHGGVQIKVYWEYIKAGRLKWWFLVVASVMLWRSIDYTLVWSLKELSEAYKSEDTVFSVMVLATSRLTIQSNPISRFFAQFPDPGVNPNPWLLAIMILVMIQAIIYLIIQIIMLVVTYTAGKNIFINIMSKISNATFRFYDVTPIGRLMNRLTGDVGTVDGPISNQFMAVTWEIVVWVSSIVAVASVTPLFLVFSLGLSAGFVFIFVKFLPTSQSLRRLEMVSLSPLMSNFGALLNGLMTVRAFHAQRQFQNRVIRVTDAFQKMDHFYWSLQSWLQYRFDTLSAVSTFLLTLLAIYSGLTPGLTAFVLVIAQRFVQSTHRLCRQYGQLQLDFVSVERVVELLHLEQEDRGNTCPPAYWPSLSSNRPAIEFENVTIRYAAHLDPALHNVSFSIPSGTSTAVIGRTGSGKSTLALSMLATIAPDSGRILVDGIDIAKVTKQDLRSRVTFLAQEPVLFQGTLRINLDPLEEHSDTDCTAVIHRIHGDTRYAWNLDTPVEAGGKNLSQGQRQLVGLARAILRRSSIVIMDEATASVDLETSWEVQRVLKEELEGSTVITIAHRASAVRDCGMVVKLHEGRLVAAGTPQEVEVEMEVEVEVEVEVDAGDLNHGIEA